jgi:RHS repeat-associated protein
LSDTRTYYEGQVTLGTVTGAGDATRSDAATGTTPAFITTGTSTFDALGRPATTTNALNQTSKVIYTPADGGPLTMTVTTNPKNQSATAINEPGRGSVITSIDNAGLRTDVTYDALGRVANVWQPEHAKDTQDPSIKYTYTTSPTAPQAITTRTLVDYGGPTMNYTTSVVLMDALGRPRQTQTDAEGGGRIVTDTVYDTHGWTTSTNNGYDTDGAPSTTMISIAANTGHSRSLTTYDGAGRATTVANYDDAVLKSSTSTVYGGDRTTVIPPQGGTTTTAVSDARGENIEQRQYTAPPTINGSVVSGGTYQSTLYHYTPMGQQDKITDAAGTTWSAGFNMLGQQYTTTDPDTGTSTSTFDNAGQVSTTTDARGQTLAYSYDELGRKIGEYEGSLSGPERASWLYDTKMVGKLTYSTRYTPNGNYISGVAAYDGLGLPNKLFVQIPASEKGLAGYHETGYSYTSTGLTSVVEPASGGGLSADGLVTTYDPLGNPLSTRGYNAYVNNTTYTHFGEPSQLTLGPSNQLAALTYDRDPNTHNVTHVNFSAQATPPQVDDTTYTYDPVGNLTRSSDTEGPVGAPTQTQCFGYDALRELNAAWTATDNCAAAPTTAAGSANVGGANPYWTSWMFDSSGMRKSQVQHALPGAASGDTSTTYTYPTAGATAPHTLSSTATTGPAGSSGTSYQYDAGGNTITRALPTGAQTLTWDKDNNLDTVTAPAGATSYVYDGDGNELIRKDPSGSTLFLPGEELTLAASTGVVTGTRYYTHAGVTVAMRVGGANPVYLEGDQHGTNQLTLDSGTGVVIRRAFDPYGNQLGTTTPVSATWPDTHGFLDKSTDAATGLTDVGARQYDPTAGRFISADPVLNSSDPQSLNGYSYADENPTTDSDPSGQCPIDKCGYGTVNNGYIALYGAIDPGDAAAGYVDIHSPGAGSFPVKDIPADYHYPNVTYAKSKKHFQKKVGLRTPMAATETDYWKAYDKALNQWQFQALPAG